MGGSLVLVPLAGIFGVQFEGFSATSTTTVLDPPFSFTQLKFPVVPIVVGTGKSIVAMSPPGSNQFVSAPFTVGCKTVPATLNLKMGSPKPAEAVAVNVKFP